MNNIHLVIVTMKFGFSEVTLLSSAWKNLKNAEIETNKIANAYRSPEKSKALILLGNPMVTISIKTMKLQ